MITGNRMNNAHRTHISNVLIIGSGAAGLRAAIAAHQAGCEVVVVGKRPRRDAHTVLAAGGINAALGTVDPEDTWQQHFADTFEEAYHLSNPRMVEIMVLESPAEVLQLADWGAIFARLPDGRLDQRFFGAHTYRRTCYAGDYTGREILHTLDRKVAELGILVIENQYISRLLVAGGVCFGAFGFDLMTGTRTVFLADAVVLAAGGHTRLWRRSSSRRDENTGDGIFLGLQAGAELMDMELVQFHPSGMVTPEDWAGTLVTEAVRGEGGILRNKDGERFMQRYDPERLELSTRDRVAMAVYTEIIEGRGTPNGGVYLDISHRSKEYILEKLPRMYRQFLEAQMLDISRQPMEVAPTAHYSMGGVAVDPDNTLTAVEGLYAAGEVTSGLHGANRLGGNSLAETLVFGRRAGEHAAICSLSLTQTRRDPEAIQAAHAELDALIRPGSELARPLQRALRDTMWESGGVVRTEERLNRGLERIAELKEQARQVDVRPSSEGYKDLAIALDLQRALVVAEATLLGAQQRRESRGAHARSDYPALDPALTGNFVIHQDGENRLHAGFRPAPPVPEALRPYLVKRGEMAVAGRLLE
jgi:succinate dehydrogenase / fumarate reductase flavoprotein subunit